MDAVCTAGRAVLEGADTAAALAELARLEQQADCFLPAAHLRRAWALTGAEAQLLYACIACLADGLPLPGRAQAAGLLARCGQAPWQGAAGLFAPGADGGCLHPVAVDFLLQRAPRLGAGARLVLCEARPCYHSAPVLAQMEAFLAGLSTPEAAQAAPGAPSAAIVLCGAAGSGRRFLFTQLAARAGLSLVMLDAPDALDETALDALARIYNAVPCACNAGAPWPLLASAPLVLYTAPAAGLEGPAPADTVLQCAVQHMGADESVRAVADTLGPEAAAAWADAAGLYRPTPGRLLAACARARGQALCGRGGPGALFAALRAENTAALAAGAQRLSTAWKLGDLVLAPRAMAQLQDLCAFARTRHTVYGTWGFGGKSAMGRGLSALFYGASGTGKTMAACAVANELGLELYRVDLSQLISKYIGETQKNIGRLFDAAARTDCVLFFDEADALFARRTDAADAQDRYSNAEIAYLLQRTEQYDGVILLATNLLQNFDEAFRRRIGFMVHFTLPDESQRLRLWQAAFPAAAPAQQLDFSLLAAQLELSGAGIRSCAVHAACLAAAEGKTITMGRVVRAARREYEKEGRAFPPRLEAMYPQERSLEQ